MTTANIPATNVLMYKDTPFTITARVENELFHLRAAANDYLVYEYTTPVEKTLNNPFHTQLLEDIDNLNVALVNPDPSMYFDPNSLLLRNKIANGGGFSNNFYEFKYVNTKSVDGRIAREEYFNKLESFAFNWQNLN